MRPSTSTLRASISLLALAVIGLAVVACSATDEVPDLERRAQQINKSVMCPVCPGESIDQSQHPLALQMRAVVDEKLGEGWSDGQVREFFVERYGPAVLLEPPAEGAHLVAWIVPPLGAALALAALYMVVRLMARPRSRPASADEMTTAERDEYVARIEAALEGDSPKGREDAG